MCESNRRFSDFLSPEMDDNILLALRCRKNSYSDFDSGIYGTDSRATLYDCSTPTKPQNPIILINEDQIVDSIEVAEIESCHQRIMTPEGNVKYRNYKAVAGAPLRVYSPSGDIHTTPKKGKIVPKYELYENDTLMPRDKIMTLLNYDAFGAKELEAIIRPQSCRRKAIELLRAGNVSNIEDKIDYINSFPYTPSISSLSMLSDDSVFEERDLTPSPPLELPSLGCFKSHSIDIDDALFDKRKCLTRQISVPCTDEPAGQLTLWDELKIADNRHPRSLTPRKMTAFEYSFFHRPASSMSAKKSVRLRNERIKGESKKMIIRNFIQRNMIDRGSNLDNLAKLALAIEEDNDESVGTGNFTTSARQMNEKLSMMIDETKELRNEIGDIQESLEEDEKKVGNLLVDVKSLIEELRLARYLDDIIELMDENLETVARRKIWPFAFYISGRKRSGNENLIV